MSSHSTAVCRPASNWREAPAARSRLPDDAAFALFALGRSVGWVAHALETAREGTLIRPRARYVGPVPDAG
ncbi:MAG: hypothetical protein H0T39_13125 [Actinobacteria bacterium]|nr:hypothetical protein [Actinomycetota bacterium]